MNNEVQESLFNQIEESLSKLLMMITEEEYLNFVENDKLMHIYEIVDSMPNKYNILTNETLTKILNNILNKIEYSK